ncbi:MAG TPA: PEGA domain-containing protein, partial [Kofleriaceae bacterium]
DFGIAKAQSAQLRTQTGRVKGKLAYMAPEALMGKPLDARSDLFAVGIIAHELLTARPLFATKNEYETLMKVQRGDIMPPSTFNQTCPPELDAIVLRALVRDPDDRFASAAALRDELHAMRRQYRLQTTERDVATWVDWAFALEADHGTQTASFDATSSAAQAVAMARKGLSAPAPGKRSDDDDSIDIAWGGDEGGSAGPVVLDDVPDVSGKHLGTASVLGAEVRLDFDDLADDIPSSQPTHGIRPAGPPVRAATTAALLARSNPRTRPPTPAAQLRSQVMTAQDAGSGRARIRTITIPPIGSNAPATRPSLSPPPPANLEATPSTELKRSVGTPRAIPAATIPPAPAQVPASSAPIATIPPSAPPRRSQRFAAAQGTDNLPTERSFAVGHPAGNAAGNAAGKAAGNAAGKAATPPAGSPQIAARTVLGHSALVPSRPSAEDFALASDTIPSMPAMPTSEPFVRFRAPTTPPPGARAGTAPPARNTGSHAVQLPVASTTHDSAPTVLADPLGLGLGQEPGIHDDAETPVVGTPAQTREQALAMARPARHAGPEAGDRADELEPDDESLMTVVSSASQVMEMLDDPPAPNEAPDEPPMFHDEPAMFHDEPAMRHAELAMRHAELAPMPPAPQPARRPGRAIVLIAGSVVLAGAIAGIALHLTHRDGQPGGTPPPPAAPAAQLGTIRLTTMPTDAAIAIAGQPLHTGSPWTIDLSPGVHQIEIRRAGYKTWLTSIDVVAGQTRPMAVSLDALDPAVVVANATLQVEPPAGHQVVLDGTTLPSGTMSRHSLAIGSHTVVLRKDGVDEWKTTFDARSSVIYDLTPILNRQAERAGGSAAPEPSAAGSAATEPPDDAGADAR